MKNCIKSYYEKLKPLKSGFIENSNFENNTDPCQSLLEMSEKDDVDGLTSGHGRQEPMVH